MKLEKREITLNEHDSLNAAFYFEKMLLGEYVECLCKIDRKETREEVLKLMCEVGEDLAFAKALTEGSAIKNGEE